MQMVEQEGRARPELEMVLVVRAVLLKPQVCMIQN